MGDWWKADEKDDYHQTVAAGYERWVVFALVVIGFAILVAAYS